MWRLSTLCVQSWAPVSLQHKLISYGKNTTNELRPQEMHVSTFKAVWGKHIYWPAAEGKNKTKNKTLCAWPQCFLIVCWGQMTKKHRLMQCLSIKLNRDASTYTHTHTLKMLFNQCKSVSIITQMLKCIPSVDTCTLNVRVKQLLNTREGKDTLWSLIEVEGSIYIPLQNAIKLGWYFHH